MDRTRFQTFTWLLWLALPLMALRHWQVWDRLPAFLAVHFIAANQPNGWMSKATALRFHIGLLAFLLTIVTLVLYLWHRRAAVTPSSWIVLLFFYGLIGVVCYVEESVLQFNLYGTAVNAGTVGMVVAALAVGLIIALIAFSRGRPLPATDLLRQEVQKGETAALIMLLALIPLLLMAAAVPAIRLVMMVVSVILLAAVAMAWDGFHYLFTRHGLEVRTLGFRLKSVPREQIKNYAVSRCWPLCGYGIRGMGGRIAYVWTHRGVRVDTSDGYVFLGHNEPEKIVHDLDAMMKPAR